MAARPKFRRRKQARPGEIVEAALQVFTEKGFAAARLDEIAARAGVSKGALYLYFETKQDLFHAVITEAIAPIVQRVRKAIESFDAPFAEFIPAFTRTLARTAAHTPVGAVGKMVISESGNFPELAKHWHDELLAPMIGLVADTIGKAQRRGEVRDGDPRLFAMQLVAPIILGVLWSRTFVPVGAEPVDLEQLAEQHARILATGFLRPPEVSP